MELFSEVYGCYFTIVSRILKQAEKGLIKPEIEQLVKNHGFYESTLHLLPLLFSGEWKLLREENKTYYSKLSENTKRPLTTLEKAWLKALTADLRLKLFLDDETLCELEIALADIEPLFLPDDFHV